MGRTERVTPPGTTSIRPDSSPVVDVALFAVILMWASTFTLFKIAWRDIDPVAFTALRFAAMVVFSVAVVALSRDRVRLRRQDIPLVIASGLSGYFLYQMGFILGLDRTSAVASSVLVATNPIFSVLFAWILWKERPARMEVAGVVVAFVGVAVFLEVWRSLGDARVGDLLSLGAAAAFGFYGVITRPLGARYPSKELMAYTLAFGGLLIAVTGIPAMVHQDWGEVSAQSWAILAYAIVGPVYVAYALWNWAIRKRGIPRTVVFGFLTPIAAWVLAVVFLHETISPVDVIGAALVLAGLVLTRLKPTLQRRSSPSVPAWED
jgi:drug/metabolite transporter (DMT)-like permease